MSHADDGTLHAYLDGELSALEAVRLEAHLSECAACRARLAEERTLVTRAGELLAAAVPPERPAPPLHQLRHPRPRWRVRLPLAWAATAVLAVAVAWFARPAGLRQWAEQPPASTPPSPQPAPAALPEVAGGAAEPLPAAPPAAPAGPPADLAQRDAAAPPPDAPAAAPPLPQAGAAARDAGRELAAAAPAANVVADAVAPVPQRADSVAAPDARAGRAERPASALVYPGGVQPYPGTISLEEARTLLAADVVAVPGLPVRAIRRARAPGFSPVIVVEQALDSSRTIAVVHRRPAAARREGVESRAREADAAPAAPGAAPLAAADTLAAAMEVEVVGALSADSLSRLRAVLAPLTRR
jgi:hypothetical protein